MVANTETTAAAGKAMVRNVAVFCGARCGHESRHVADARRLGTGLAARNIGLIYGGSRIGLMGVLADAVLDGGGRVAGVIPGFLSEREIRHDRVTDLTVTKGMHDRKRIMFERADAFVTLPGGLGTLDETVEVLTWRQLGLHDKPIVIVDGGGAATHLLRAVEAAIAEGFADPSTRALFTVAPDIDAVLAVLERLPRPSGAGSPA